MPYIYEDTLQGETRNALTIPSTTGDVLSAQFQQGYEENPIMALKRFSDLAEAQVTGPRVSAEDARTVLQAAGMENDIKVSDVGITRAALNTLIERKRVEKRRQEIFARSEGGFGENAARFGVAVGATLTDPVSFGLNFVPVVGQTRYARWLNTARSIGARIAIRGAVGAAEGAVGAAIAEVPIYAMRTQEQADYDMADSLLNVAFGGVIGVGLHTTVGSAAELLSRPRPVREPAPTVIPETPETAPVHTPAQDAPLVQSVNPEARALENDLNRMLDTQEQALRAVTEGQDARVVSLRDDFSKLNEQLQSARGALDEAAATLSEPRDAQVAREADRLAEADEKNRYARRRARETGEPSDIVFPKWQKLAAETVDGVRERAAKQADLAREVIRGREADIARVNRVRSAETDLAQSRFLRTQARSLVDLAAALPAEARQRMESRIAALDEAGRAHIVGAQDMQRVVDAMKPEMQQAALRTAVAQAVEGRQINVSGPANAVRVEPELQQALQHAEEAIARDFEPTAEGNLKAAEEEADLAVSEATEITKRLGVDMKEDADFAAVMEGVDKAERWARVAELATVCLVRGG